jgi:hypothetical protein
MSNLKYQNRSARRRVTKPSTSSLVRKFFRKYGRNNAIQFPSVEQQRVAADRHHSLIAAGAVQVQDAYYLDQAQFAEVEKRVLGEKWTSVREDSKLESVDTIIKTEQDALFAAARLPDEMLTASIGFTAKASNIVKRPDGTFLVNGFNLTSVSLMTSPKQCGKVSQMQMEGRALRKKNKAAFFALAYDLGAHRFAKNLKRHDKERHAFKMKCVRRIRHLAHAGKAPRSHGNA